MTTENRVTGSLATLDLTQLEEAFDRGSPEMARTLQLFLETIDPILRKLEAAVARADHVQGAELAHEAKGVANVTGAKALGMLCADIEQALKQGDGVRAAKLAEGLSHAHGEVVTAVRAALASFPAAR